MACLAPQSSAVEQAGLSLCARTEKDVPAFQIFVQMNKIFDKVSSNVQNWILYANTSKGQGNECKHGRTFKPYEESGILG